MVWRTEGGVEGPVPFVSGVRRRRSASASGALASLSSGSAVTAARVAAASDAASDDANGGGSGGLGTLHESDEEMFDEVMSWVSTMDRSMDDLDAD